MKSSERGLVLLAAGVVALLLLPGCSIISPMPAWELLKGVGAVASLALDQADSRAVDTVRHPHAGVSELCIAFNPQAEVADLVPSLQIALRRHGVDSRVYHALQQVPACRVWLHYATTIDWATPYLSHQSRPFLATAALTLRTSEGQVLSSSHYALTDGLRTDRWAPTRDKLSPVVSALLTDVENVGFFQCPPAPPRAQENPHASPFC